MNQKLICFKHPKNDATVLPELSCKTCCSIFVKAVKERQSSKSPKSALARQQWLEERERLANRDHFWPAQLNFTPEFI